MVKGTPSRQVAQTPWARSRSTLAGSGRLFVQLDETQSHWIPFDLYIIVSRFILFQGLYCKNRAKSYGPFPHGGNSLNKWISTLPAIVELRVSYFYDIMQSSKKNTAERQTKKLRQHGTANRKTKTHYKQSKQTLNYKGRKIKWQNTEQSA